MLLLLIPLHFIGKKIAGKWYLTSLFVLAAWAIMNFATTVLETACGYDFVTSAMISFGLGTSGILSFAVGLILILILRRFDGMLEDQKSYLRRVDDERKERTRRDEFGDEPIEIDEDTLSILRRREDEFDK